MRLVIYLDEKYEKCSTCELYISKTAAATDLSLPPLESHTSPLSCGVIVCARLTLINVQLREARSWTGTFFRACVQFYCSIV